MPLRENIIDARFNGREVEFRVLGAPEPIKGVVDEVSRYEIGVVSKDKVYVIFRHAILAATVEPSDLHGFSTEQLNDTVIDAELIGIELELHLIDGSTVSGTLSKISKYELGVRAGDKGLIIPKSSITYAVLKSQKTGT
jgi:sRNA-binding regulator protein Hfq